MGTALGSPCAGCGELLGPGRPNRRYHGPSCRKLAFRARRRGRSENDLSRAADAAWRLIAEGRVDPLLALSLVVDPSPGVLEALEAVAA